jgi:hypothetical protein
MDNRTINALIEGLKMNKLEVFEKGFRSPRAGRTIRRSATACSSLAG